MISPPYSPVKYFNSRDISGIYQFHDCSFFLGPQCSPELKPLFAHVQTTFRQNSGWGQKHLSNSRPGPPSLHPDRYSTASLPSTSGLALCLSCNSLSAQIKYQQSQELWKWSTDLRGYLKVPAWGLGRLGTQCPNLWSRLHKPVSSFPEFLSPLFVAPLGGEKKGFKYV